VILASGDYRQLHRAAPNRAIGRPDAAAGRDLTTTPAILGVWSAAQRVSEYLDKRHRFGAADTSAG
jgi:hypothetical protein